MQQFTIIIAVSALIAGASANPIRLAARATCGSTPAGSGNLTPISQPSGITTAVACQAQCDANTSCLSFVFGMLNNADQCMLFSVAAASVPKQASANLVVYDKTCTSVPAIVPTAPNPTGANTGSMGPNNGANHKLTVRETCGTAPAGSGSQAPLSQPTGITTAAACLAQCDANSACLSFVFGMVNNADECMLYSVAASAIPTQTSTNLVAYDKACPAVPSVVPTTSNPQGFATGSTSSGSTGNTGSTSSSGSSGPTSSPGPTGPSNGATPAHKRANTCGAAPTGPSNNASPISTPANINSVAACKAQCSADSSCKSFEFGTLTPGGAQVCKLFPVAAASVPAPTSGQSIIVYDVGCSV